MQGVKFLQELKLNLLAKYWPFNMAGNNQYVQDYWPYNQNIYKCGVGRGICMHEVLAFSTYIMVVTYQIIFSGMKGLNPINFLSTFIQTTTPKNNWHEFKVNGLNKLSCLANDHVRGEQGRTCKELHFLNCISRSTGRNRSGVGSLHICVLTVDQCKANIIKLY